MITLPQKRTTSIQAGDPDAECAQSRIELLACARDAKIPSRDERDVRRGAEQISRRRALCTRQAMREERATIASAPTVNASRIRAVANAGERRAVATEATVAAAPAHAVMKITVTNIKKVLVE
jgi:hypothetical protein